MTNEPDMLALSACFQRGTWALIFGPVHQFQQPAEPAALNLVAVDHRDQGGLPRDPALD